MIFQPAPPNDFAAFSAAYYERCCARIPQILASAAKWRFEDLIPGLSDFDTRFIYAEPMRAQDWSDTSLAIGQVHTEMAFEFPHWARNLEHLPGLNLTAREMKAPELFYPEYQQWTFYHGDAGTIDGIRQAVKSHTWTSVDEGYHLKKIAAFFGPYNRSIDPPVNLGLFENKYPLHSRFMHYFTPCVQAMVSLRLKQNVQGKLEALRLASRLLPNPRVIDRVFEGLDRHYECPTWYEEPELSKIEAELEAYLSGGWASLEGAVTLLKLDAADDRNAIGRKVSAIDPDAVEAFFSGTRFARQMKGRLLFFAQDIPWFDSRWLIRIELGRIVKMLFVTSMNVIAELRYADAIGDPMQTLAQLEGDLLDAEQCAGFRRFVEVASRPVERGQEKAAARAVADCCDPALEAVTILGEFVSRYAATRNAPGAVPVPALDRGHRPALRH